MSEWAKEKRKRAVEGRELKLLERIAVALEKIAEALDAQAPR